ENVELQEPLDGRSDLAALAPVHALQHPCRLGHREHADIGRLRLAQIPLDERRLSGRLRRLVLHQIPDQNIRIEADHFRRRRGQPAAAPATIAWSISSSVTGRRPGRFSMPRAAEAGSFGKRTTVPSGWTKNFTRSPALS